MKNLVLYFSVYETTKAVATEIAKQTGADLVEIEPVKPDVLLKDLIAIFHPELVEKDYTPTFYRLLK